MKVYKDFFITKNCIFTKFLLLRNQSRAKILKFNLRIRLLYEHSQGRKFWIIYYKYKNSRIVMLSLSYKKLDPYVFFLFRIKCMSENEGELQKKKRNTDRLQSMKIHSFLAFDLLQLYIHFKSYQTSVYVPSGVPKRRGRRLRRLQPPSRVKNWKFCNIYIEFIIQITGNPSVSLRNFTSWFFRV